jgi:hypothetical protein
MTFKTLATAACIALSSATASLAAPINLDFTVGDVSGTFYGLDDAIFSPTPQSATSFDLFTPIATWTGVNSSSFGDNSFVFSKSGLLSYNFYSRFPANILDDTFSVLLLSIDVLNDPAGGYPYFTALTGDGEGSNVAYDQEISFANFTISPISPVPLPAGGLLLLSGLAGVAALKRRKKRTA